MDHGSQETQELRTQKRQIRWFLYQMQNSGIPISKKFTLDDDLNEMLAEVERVSNEWNLRNSPPQR